MSNVLTGTEAESRILKIFIEHLLFARCCPGCFAYGISFNGGFKISSNQEIPSLNPLNLVEALRLQFYLLRM